MRSFSIALALVALSGAASAESATIRFEIVRLHDAAGLHLVPAVIYATEGDTISLQVVNEGNAVHNLTVCGDPSSPLVVCRDVWARTGEIPPGGNETIRFTAERAGTFDYYWARGDTKGPAPGQAGGMWGQLVVSEAERGVPAGGLAVGALALAAAALLGRRS